jgi:Tol biopolymer transport system component
VDGTDSTRIEPDGISTCCPRWSPDGSSILFTDVDGRVLTIGAEGGDVTEVFAQDGAWASWADWSPDGSRIMFILNSTPELGDSTAPNEIWVAGADGHNPQPVITTDDHKGGLAWVPSVEPGS